MRMAISVVGIKSPRFAKRFSRVHSDMPDIRAHPEIQKLVQT